MVLDAQTVGVIVGVDKDSCRVLTNQGRPEKPDLRVCRLPDIKRKMDSRRSSAQDGSECRRSLLCHSRWAARPAARRGAAQLPVLYLGSFLLSSCPEPLPPPLLPLQCATRWG